MPWPPRLPRLIVPHCPHHVVQRGHSRQAVFVSADDYDGYLADINEKKIELGVQLHAYCLMTNHVHLLLTPGDDVTGVARLMKEVARRATRRFNNKSARSGSLWESRYKSSVVQSETYLLACMRYIELNPVRADMVARCEDYQWSSYRARMGLCKTLVWICIPYIWHWPSMTGSAAGPIKIMCIAGDPRTSWH